LTLLLGMDCAVAADGVADGQAVSASLKEN